MYSGLRLGGINKMISMRCDEVREHVPYLGRPTSDQQEILSFLKHVKEFWYKVFEGNETAMKRLDRSTVEGLQHTAPGAFEAESRAMYGRVRRGDLFGAFDEAARERLWNNVCAATTDCLVPSLDAFFENIKYLRMAADCVKRLLRLGRKQTIRGALENAFCRENNELLVETSPTTFKAIEKMDMTDYFDITYRQLWLYAFREFGDVPAEPKKKLAGPKGSQIDEYALHGLASIAQRLGYRTKEIDALLRRDPDREMARRLLTTARKPDQFVYSNIEDCVTRIAQVISTAHEIDIHGTRDDYEDIRDDSKPPARFGIPLVLDHARDKPLMFLDKLHFSRVNPASELTSFFIQRSIYFGFFGRHVDLSADQFAAPGRIVSHKYRGPQHRAENPELADPRLYEHDQSARRVTTAEGQWRGTILDPQQTQTNLGEDIRRQGQVAEDGTRRDKQAWVSRRDALTQTSFPWAVHETIHNEAVSQSAGTPLGLGVVIRSALDTEASLDDGRSDGRNSTPSDPILMPRTGFTTPYVSGIRLSTLDT